MFTIILVIIIVIILYPKWRSLTLPRNRRIIVDYINEITVDKDALRTAIANLFPPIDYSFSVCGLTPDDLLQEDESNTLWTAWPEDANTIHYQRIEWYSDKILYQRFFYAKNCFVLHNQIFDSLSGRRKDTVYRADYDSLIPDSARITTSQYRTKKSNLGPNTRLDKSNKYKYGNVLTVRWLEIPSKNGNASDSIRLVSLGESADKVVPEKIKSILASRTRRVATFGIANNSQGKEPASIDMERYDPMAKLQSLIGLASVKKEIETMRDFIFLQKMRKEKGLQTSDISLHMVFTGNPGTGKTTVARIVAYIFHEAGLLPTDNLIEVDRSGLVAEYIGQTAIKTNSVIDSAIGGVLFIDEAYTLAPEDNPRDFGPEAIATLMKRMEDDRGKFAVILAGYSDNMDTFMKSNPGLKSRFPRTIAFPDYTCEELVAIINSIADSMRYTFSDGGLKALSQRVEDDVKAKDKGFGNGRYARILFERAILNQAARLKRTGVNTDDQLLLLTEEDIPAGDKIMKSVNPLDALNSLIGLSSVKDEIRSLRNFISLQKKKKEKGLQTTDISLHTIFTGNPGTGKTTVARIIAAIFHESGLLPTENLIEVDRSGLVGEFIGQTAIKTNEVIDKAIGGVLFIDEAYALSQGGANDFGKEAISTLIKRMEDDRGRFAVILAGYTEDMSDFMNTNPGLKSRFPRVFNFPDYSVDELKQIFLSMAADHGYRLSDDGENALTKRIEEDVKVKDKKFGNGRYVRNLFEKAILLQANRLEAVPDPSGEDLTTLIEKDIAPVFN